MLVLDSGAFRIGPGKRARKLADPKRKKIKPALMGLSAIVG